MGLGDRSPPSSPPSPFPDSRSDLTQRIPKRPRAYSVCWSSEIDSRATDRVREVPGNLGGRGGSGGGGEEAGGEGGEGVGEGWGGRCCERTWLGATRSFQTPLQAKWQIPALIANRDIALSCATSRVSERGIALFFP